MFTKATLLALVALTAAAPTAESELPKLAIRGSKYRPNADGSANIPLLLKHVNDVLAKYGSKERVTSSLATRAVASEPLTDEFEAGEDELYYGTGTIGSSSPQSFTIDFDTGSSDLFVPGPSCGTAQGCTGTTKYNQMGVDQHNTTSVTYGSGMIEGENYFDKVCVAGLCASHTNVISLTDASGFNGSASEGLMGLAFQSIAQSGQPTFFQNLVTQGVVSKPEFSFFLGREKSGTTGQSELTLGGADTSKYSGAMTLVPVTNQTYWQVALQSATVNGKSAGALTKGQAAIDTGTTLLLAPTLAATSIFARIPGALPLPLLSGSPTITFFGFPCSSTAKVALTFSGKSFAVNPLDFNLGTLASQLGLSIGKNYCLAGLAAADVDPTENLYIVGDTFLKNWYSTFSYTSANGSPGVSFAVATANQ